MTKKSKRAQHDGLLPRNPVEASFKALGGARVSKHKPAKGKGSYTRKRMGVRLEEGVDRIKDRLRDT